MAPTEHEIAADLKALVGYFTPGKVRTLPRLRLLAPGDGAGWPHQVLEEIVAAIDRIGRRREQVAFGPRKYPPTVVRRAFRELYGLAGRLGGHDVRRQAAIEALGLSVSVDRWREPGGLESQFLTLLARELVPQAEPPMYLTIEATKYFDAAGVQRRVEVVKEMRATRPGITSTREAVVFPEENQHATVVAEPLLRCAIDAAQPVENGVIFTLGFAELPVNRPYTVSYALNYTGLAPTALPVLELHSDRRDERFRLTIASERAIATAWRYEHAFDRPYVPVEPDERTRLQPDSTGRYSADFRELRPNLLYGIRLKWAD